MHISPARPDDTPLTLIGELRKRVRLRHYSRRTETAYVMWTRRYVRFHHKRHPRTLGCDDVRAFLSDLAIRLQVSASTQNQALAGLLFLYRHVLDAPLPWLEGIERARSPARLPVVLTRSEVAKVLEEMTAAPKLMATLDGRTGTPCSPNGASDRCASSWPSPKACGAPTSAMRHSVSSYPG